MTNKLKIAGLSLATVLVLTIVASGGAVAAPSDKPEWMPAERVDGTVADAPDWMPEDAGDRSTSAIPDGDSGGVDTTDSPEDAPDWMPE